MAFIAPLLLSKRSLSIQTSSSRTSISPQTKIIATCISSPLSSKSPFRLTSATPPGLLFTYKTQIYPHQSDYSTSLHHSRYITLLEESRVEYLAALNFPYDKIVREYQLELVVVDLNIRYRQPIKMGERVEIDTWLMGGRDGGLRVEIGNLFRVGERVMAKSGVCLVCVDAKTGRLRKDKGIVKEIWDRIDAKVEELKMLEFGEGNGRELEERTESNGNLSGNEAFRKVSKSSVFEA